MPVFVVVGVAGSGKTSYSMDLIERYLINGLKWHEIGFSSFSRAACLTAVQRAAKITGEDESRLSKSGWFRTVHSAALRCLGIDAKCILDHESAEGKKFLTEHLGGTRGGERGTLGAKIDEALSAWDFSRARLSRLKRSADPDVSVDKSRVSSEKSSVLSSKDTRTDRQTDGIQYHSGACVRADSNVLYGNPHREPTTPIRKETEHSINNYLDSNCEIQINQEGQTVRYMSCDDEKSALYIGTGRTDIPKGFCPESVSMSIEYAKTLDLSGFAGHIPMIQKYEEAKSLYGRLDFTDLLFSYAGLKVTEDLMFAECYPNGAAPEEVKVWMFDEWQDSSPLLEKVAQRLSENLYESDRDVFYLGDRYQTVYGFSGASSHVFGGLEDRAIDEGNRVLLNRSWRNPDDVLTWGEAILSEDAEYKSRNPVSEAGDGSVGLLDLQEFWKVLPRLAGTDSMILCRTWFGLAGVKRVLDDLCIPWRSCQEKASSRWECPAKIAYTLVMRDLMAGEKISEQDWRRVIETLPVKWECREIFVRGAKAKWKKMECGREPVRDLGGVEEWGATQEFVEFVRRGKWRTDMPLLLDTAIEKYGIDEVRNPSIQLGSVHSVKGGEARNVFCLAASTGRVDTECDQAEERCLKYVAITRASRNYRLVVDRLDVARGRPMFWAAPRGSKEWREFDDFETVGISRKETEGAEDEGIDYSDINRELGREAILDLDCESACGTVCEERVPGSDTVRHGPVRRDRNENAGRSAESDAEVPAGEDDYGWWKF